MATIGANNDAGAGNSACFTVSAQLVVISLTVVLFVSSVVVEADGEELVADPERFGVLLPLFFALLLLLDDFVVDFFGVVAPRVRGACCAR